MLPPFERLEDTRVDERLRQTVLETGRMSAFLDVIPHTDLWRADFGAGGSTFVKPYIQKPLHVDEPHESHIIYALDMDENLEVMGLAFCAKQSATLGGVAELPYVEHNQTRPAYRRLGLEVRRLVVLNEFCQKVAYGGSQPLSSGRLLGKKLGDPEIRLWNRLVNAGLAVKAGDRYHFKSMTDD